MKKTGFFILVAAAGMFLVSCEKEAKVNVATFEDVTVGENKTNANYTTDGVHGWTSGEFAFTTASAYAGTYYYNFVVSAQESAEYKDYNDQYHSAQGGAAEGSQFAVAYQDLFSEGAALEAKLSEAKVVPGCYFCNNAYAVSSMSNGDTFAKKFAAGDWFLLTITGYNAEKETGKVEFYLADFRDGKSDIVKNWTFCSLKALGAVDKLTFALTSSDSGEFGMNTPAYFCLDNLGAKK